MRIRRSAIPLVILSLLATTGVVFGRPDPASANEYYSSLAENGHPDWMAELQGDASLAELSIPGTHETLSLNGGQATVTQELHRNDDGIGGDELGFQLRAGIRAIDIRVRMVDDEKFAIHHGVFYQQANFDDVLRELRTFLREHPTETVLMHLKAECTGETGSCSDMDPCADCPKDGHERRRGILNSYVEANKELFWDLDSATGKREAEMPTLDEVRGKVVLANFNGPFGGNYAGYGFKQLGYEAWASESDDAPNCYLQNTWKVGTISDINDKWERVHAHLDRTNAAQDCRDPSKPNADKMYWNWTSGSSLGAYPYTVAGGTPTATGVNGFLYQCLIGENNRCDTPAMKRTGVMMMDFPGDGLVKEIIERNPRGPSRSANGGAGDPMEQHAGGDDGGTRPGVPSDHAACRPDGLTPTAGTSTPYCRLYDGQGREWLGADRSRRVIGYFNGTRTGADGRPYYLVKNVPWSKVTHLNYAFANVTGNKISVGADGPRNPAIGMTWPGVRGAEMDESLPYRGHFNLLTKYKRLHPRVKTLISVGGWAESGGFYSMTTNADGTTNQAGIDTFADSVVAFLKQYGFDGVDIDFEYPTALDDTGNPNDWADARPRRKGLPAAYTALMKTLRERLDKASAATSDRYYLLTSASSASGYLVRGMENQKALRYQDFTNLMAYDYHGTWNDVVGPNAALFDDGKDPELAELYNTPEYQKIGYFNTDWAVHYLRGALQAGRINIGIPYYTRGWRNVSGGSSGLWGKSVGSGCQPGTGLVRPCGDGAVGIDNIWHDLDGSGKEVGAGVNPMWHAKNLERNILPRYAEKVGLTPGTDAADKLTGTYARHWDRTTRTSWLWNAEKKTFLSTEDMEGVDQIIDYVNSSGAGGVMMWELAGDYDCPETITADRPCGMGYTLTRRLHERLQGFDAYDNTRAAGSSAQPSTTAVDVTVDLVGYPADAANLWPLQPTVRVTNNTGVTIGGGKDNAISFDLPTSTPALIKDGNWQTAEQGGRWKVQAGHTGPNAGSGLGGDFHRLSVALDYCEIIPAGKSLDIPIIYYIPATGPVNTAVKVGGKTYAPVADHNRGAAKATPAAGGCSAPAWDASKIYKPASQTVEEVTVKHAGKVWRAKWETQGAVPGTGVDADHEPWRYIGPAS